MRSEESKVASAPPIGGCYRIEAEIGHGGTARVYRVLDERTGQRFALKKFSRPGAPSAAVLAMFEREYHTLVQLAHPRIIRAFDYGFEGDDPYYTMELLEGTDARELARSEPLSANQACAILRDVASALALIHSRRLVHRDVSPRNVWCTPDGRAKLIDFGTLVAMGPQTRAAGTPPFVPPEALYLQPLDARCDLYALGALAYYLLTRRYGYPARDLRELHQVWQRRPPRPDALRPELPSALCELVMAMMSLDARGRPASAAEVLEQLSAIGGLAAAEDERHAAQSFLISPSLVGREDAAVAARRRMRRAGRGHGGTLPIVAPPGLGRSRLLSSIVLDAKLSGMTAVSLDAAAAGSGPLALATTLAERLLEAVPGLAEDARELAPLLGQLSSELHAALGGPEPAQLAAGERGRKLGGALLSLVISACAHGRLLIAVDDVHRADAGSLDVLARVSLSASGHPLLLVTTCEEAALAQAPLALAQLAGGESRITLGPLAKEATRELLGSLFGESQGLDEAAGFLHELSQGSPQTCMQYAQYLVDHGIARYRGGRWELPARLRQAALPPTLDAMLEARISALSEDARVLALGLALARDDSRAAWQPEIHLQLHDFPTLLDVDLGPRTKFDSVRATAGASRTFAALNELLHAGVVQQRDNTYVLGQRVLADALLRQSDAALRATLHERLAAIFEGGQYGAPMLTVRQLQRAGKHARARERLSAISKGLGAAAGMDFGAMRVSVTAECAQRALADWRQSGGSPREGIALRTLLLFTASVYDWGLVAVGDEQLERLRRDSGLVYLEGADAAQPELPQLLQALKRAQEVYEATPETERGLSPADAVRELAACVVPLQAAYSHAHDVEGTRRVLRVFQPLRALTPLLALVADMCQLTVDRTVGRELDDSVLSLGVVRLSAADVLPDVLRRGGAAINSHTQALLDARCGRERALELPARLAEMVGDEMFLVAHARWLAYAFRGDAEQARKQRKLLDVMTEDDVWRRKAALFVEVELHALTGDLTELHRTSETIAELAARFPGWKPWALFATASLQRLRGEHDAARADLEAALALAGAGEHRAWPRLAPAYAQILLRLGDAEGALRSAEATIETVDRLDLDRTAAIEAGRLAARAESVLGRHDAARARIVRVLEQALSLEYDGLPLAQLHETEARIALAAGDANTWLIALTRVRGLLERADAPALIQAYEALREEGAQLAVAGVPAAVGAAGMEEVAGTTEIATQASSRQRTRSSDRP